MLESLLGNATVEKILLFIENYGLGYPKQIADNFNLRVNAVQQQVKRLEDGGVLVSRLYGRVRLYEFNPRYPFLNELRAILKKVFQYLSRKDIDTFYMKRTRPRRAGKPVRK